MSGSRPTITAEVLFSSIRTRWTSMLISRRSSSRWTTLSSRMKLWPRTGNWKLSLSRIPRKCCPLWWVSQEIRSSSALRCPFTSMQLSSSFDSDKIITKITINSWTISTSLSIYSKTWKSDSNTDIETNPPHASRQNSSKHISRPPILNVGLID